jgi:hypothetical protein
MRKTLYIIYVPLLLVEWAVDLGHKVVEIFHKSIEDITLALQKYIHEPDKPDAN